jgi:ABC-type polysaccharide/polyol phosphate export permease
MAEDSISLQLPVRQYSAERHASFGEEWRDLREHAHLLYNLVYRDLTVRYKRSVLGFMWTMLNPLLMMIIFTVVFSHLFRFEIPHYETYFLSAFVPWNFFAQTTLGAMTSMAWNGSLMKRVRVPKSIFALATLLAGIVNLLLSYVPLLGIMVVLGVPIRPAILFLPVSILILAVFTFGVALALSAVSVYFTDVREMYQVAITAIMYLTPIIYPLSIVPERFRGLIIANPLFYIIEVVRRPIFPGQMPPADMIGIAGVLAVVSVFIGWTLFSRLSRGFYPHL